MLWLITYTRISYCCTGTTRTVASNVHPVVFLQELNAKETSRTNSFGEDTRTKFILNFAIEANKDGYSKYQNVEEWNEASGFKAEKEESDELWKDDDDDSLMLSDDELDELESNGG